MPISRARKTAALITSLLLCALPLSPAAGQDADPEIRLRLVDQPLWHEPGDPLGLRLQVFNSSSEVLEGFVVRVEGHSRVSSRSALHEAFDGNPGFSSSSFSKYFDNVEIPAGASKTVVIKEPVGDLTSIATAPGGGVFPVTLSLFDSGAGELFDSMTTPLIYYPTPPDVPLGLTLAWPLNDVPSRSPSGSFEVDPLTAAVRLEDALQPDGWLTGLLQRLEAVTLAPPPPEPPRRRDRQGRRRGRADNRPRPEPTPPLHLGLALTPRLIEEMADLADGYQRGDVARRRDSEVARQAAEALELLRIMLARDSVEPLLVPYSFPDLPRMSFEDGLVPQLGHAREVLAKELDLDLADGWLFPPAGRIDAATLQDLKTIDTEVGGLILTEESFEPPVEDPPPGCPVGSPSFVCPVSIQGTGRSPSLLTDEGLQDRFTDLVDGLDPRLGIQNFFAETAMIREETPGVAGRVVQTTVPSLWHPEPSTMDLVLEGLREAPWLQTLTPSEALDTEVEPGPRRLVPTLGRLAIQEPTEELLARVASAQELVESFRLVRPPPALTERLTRNLLVAQSRLWGASALLSDRADDYVDETVEQTRAELDKITVGGTDEIRLTSQRGEIPIEVFNDTDYEVTLNVRVVSPDLRLDETYPLVLDPGRFQQIPVEIAARSSGIFPVEVSVETPDGTYEIDTKSITVRSTEFNQIAVIITIGALAFLVLFYLVPSFRRRADAEAA